MRPILKNVCLQCQQLSRQDRSRHRTLSTLTSAGGRQIRANGARRANAQQWPRQASTSLRDRLEKRRRDAPPRFATAEAELPREDDAQPEAPRRKYRQVRWQEVQELGGRVLQMRDAVPTEESILKAMEALEAMASQLTQKPTASQLEPDPTASASTLLTLDDRMPSEKGNIPTADDVSSLAYSILKHPSVFINPDILKSYIATQALLREPSSFPEAFHLYANKPVPKPNSSPVVYTPQNSKSRRAAIPTDVANLALTSALRCKDLELCLDIIDTSFRTKAHWNNRVFTRLVPPMVFITGAPLVAYLLAMKLTGLSSTEAAGAASPEGMRMIIWSGAVTYLGVVGSLGFVALSTANDQMRRVTWATGTPLSERWIREDERAAMDRVVQAWGFSESWRRGEEEGLDWEYLKEWIQQRGCIVDRVELMPGMQ